VLVVDWRVPDVSLSKKLSERSERQALLAPATNALASRGGQAAGSATRQRVAGRPRTSS
jgi:hypothetical protein